MDITDLIAPLVIFGFLLAPSIKKWLAKRQKEQNPEEFARQQREKDAAFKEMMRTMGMEDEEDEEPVPQVRPKPPIARAPAPKPRPQAPPAVRQSLDHRHLQVKTEQRHLQVKTEQRHYTQQQPHLDLAEPHAPARSVSAADAYHATKVTGAPSRGARLVASTQKRREMVILHELFAPPRALRNYAPPF